MLGDLNISTKRCRFEPCHWGNRMACRHEDGYESWLLSLRNNSRQNMSFAEHEDDNKLISMCRAADALESSLAKRKQRNILQFWSQVATVWWSTCNVEAVISMFKLWYNSIKRISRQKHVWDTSSCCYFVYNRPRSILLEAKLKLYWYAFQQWGYQSRIIPIHFLIGWLVQSFRESNWLTRG